jgi:hypothetical protein
VTDAPEMLEVTVIVTVIGRGQGTFKHSALLPPPHDIAGSASAAHCASLEIESAPKRCLYDDRVEAEDLVARMTLLRGE